MKKALSLFILFIAFIATSPLANAAGVSLAQAQTAAINFYRVYAKSGSAHGMFTATLKYTKKEADNTVDFYVFDITPGKGFVIISADDRVSPVLAYSTESNFNLSEKAAGVQCWLTDAGSHIHQAVLNNIVSNATINNQWAAYLSGQKPVSEKSSAAVVAPLLTTTWDQEPYYNQLCPFNATDNQQTVTGCVATAMAQIMKYWNYPAQGTGQYAYDDAPPYCFNNYGDQSANFGATTYNWAAMPDSLNGPNNAVATLMYHCGVAVAMDYGDDNQGGSGAYVLAADVPSWKHTAQMAYTTYFKYNQNTIQGVRMSDYTSTDWINLMENELTAGRPVQYVGTDAGAGTHTWVCDGFDANDLLHMNWGWGGLDNGYYNVSLLAADGYNFSTREEALIGIEPANNLTVNAAAANVSICSGAATTLTAQGGAASASYTWFPATGLTCATCAVTAASPATTTTYTVTMDSAGLSAAAQVTVIVNSKMNVESTEVNDVTCYGGTNGTAAIEVSGGAPTYTYLWSNGGSTQSITGLAAGNYNVTVTDANACTVSVATTIIQPDVLLASVTAADNTCSLSNAMLNVYPQGGTPPYSFGWSTGQNTASVPSPVAGNYTVSVSDASACTVSVVYAVNQPAVMDVNITASNTACSLLYATATANVTGNSQNISYAWSNGESTPSITDLTAGNISVTVTNALGCSSSASQNFAQLEPMNVSITTSEADDNKVYGKAVANVTGGTPKYSYLWSTGDNTPEISGLLPGNYAVTITDNKGCVQTAATQVSSATGISNAGAKIAFEVYPNPASNYATVLLDGTGANYTMEIKNVLGQTLSISEIANRETQLDLTEFPNGIYFVSVTQGRDTNIKEIVIQK